jgi:hypothetical protein
MAVSGESGVEGGEEVGSSGKEGESKERAQSRFEDDLHFVDRAAGS